MVHLRTIAAGRVSSHGLQALHDAYCWGKLCWRTGLQEKLSYHDNSTNFLLCMPIPISRVCSQASCALWHGVGQVPAQAQWLGLTQGSYCGVSAWTSHQPVCGFHPDHDVGLQSR